ncbi:hypothetical protein GW17_00007814 [Ensete ventricosum]|nr:hypothetical protein GW17_00007814 [Ensete ventricosum]
MLRGSVFVERPLAAQLGTDARQGTYVSRLAAFLLASDFPSHFPGIEATLLNTATASSPVRDPHPAPFSASAPNYT